MMSLLSTIALAEDVVLVQDGNPVARIYVPKPLLDSTVLTMTPQERSRAKLNEDDVAYTVAVTELNEHVGLMSGTQLEVVVIGDPSEIKSPAVVLGDLAVQLGAQPLKTTESLEGFRVLVKDGLVLIGGQSNIAIRHGVYFLLRELGCDWVMPGEIGRVIPKRSTIRLKQADVSQAPDFLFRQLWYRGYPQPRLADEARRYERWQQRQLTGAWRHPLYRVQQHAWSELIRRHPKTFSDDPSMLALRRVDGGGVERKGPQIESTHEKVIDLFVQEITDTYEAHIKSGEWTKDTAAGFPIGPADGDGYSVSAESIAAGAGRIDPIIGEQDRTDELILMGNRILERVTPRYPNAHVGYYVYSVHADYPARYKPHPNIVAVFAPIMFSRFHSISDTNSKTQPYSKHIVEQWSKLSKEQGNILWFRGYTWNLADNMLPYSKVRIWGEELPYYHRQGFIGLNVESTKMWALNASSDYVFMRLAWDTTLNWRDVLAEFCHSAYGNGAEAMLRYYHRLIETQHDAGHEAGSFNAMHLIFDRQWVSQSQSDIKQALAAATTESDKQRITLVSQTIHAMSLYLDYHEATRRFDFEAAKKHYDAMQAYWQTRYDSNSDMVANETPTYLRRFLEAFVNKAHQYTSSPYQLALPLPDAMKTMLDPTASGDLLGFQNPSINDSEFITTRTYSTTWDAQGLGAFREGAVWYRYHFTLPKHSQGKPLGLFLGGVEDEARVWLNGHLIGSSGRSFSVPFVYDLTDAVVADGNNVLAIQVIRNGKINEIGLGGILRPSFLFTGPQLERKAPQVINKEVILPGGEVAPQ